MFMVVCRISCVWLRVGFDALWCRQQKAASYAYVLPSLHGITIYETHASVFLIDPWEAVYGDGCGEPHIAPL